MPHIPDSHHDSHDLELVAAFAAGDATGPALDAATTLVASCTTCAELHHDLRAIAAAMPAVPAPARTRDFRITPEQAARLRPSGIRGLLAAFGSPRLAFAAPLGTGMAALGIIGVLVASGGAPLGGPTDGAGVDDPATRITMEASQEAIEGAGGDAPGQAPASGAPAASSGLAQLPDDTAASDAPGAQADILAASVPPDGQAPNGSEAAAARAADQTMLILGGALVIVGLALLALRWTGRRIA